MPFDAGEDHYGCPAPVNPLNGEVKSFLKLITKIFPEKRLSHICIGQVEKRNWWTELWFQSLYEAEVANEFIEENKPFNASTFRSSVSKFLEKK